MNTEEMVFDDLAPIEVPVKLGDKRYILREASADATAKYRNAVMKGASVDKTTGKILPGEMASAEPIAVASCLLEVFDPNKPPRPVLLTTVLGWKGSVVAKLFDRLKAISPDLVRTEEDEKERIEEAKNGPSAGTDISA